MKIIIAGSSGLVGSALRAALQANHHQVIPLVRRVPQTGEIRWDPEAGELDPSTLLGADAVVHLGGENIADGRWTAAKKERIRSSRLRGTRLLSDALASLQTPPPVLLTASAIGYYGDRGDELVDEASAVGSGFLPELCADWEAASNSAEHKGVRVIRIRIGIVLSSDGGALRKMLPAFKLGIAGRVGNGQQYMSWIDIDDLVGAIGYLLQLPDAVGTYNGVAPNPVTNRAFTKVLGQVLRRPTLFPMPAAAVRLIFGEMGNDLLLASTRVQPARLLSSGYEFQYPQLRASLRHLLRK